MEGFRRDGPGAVPPIGLLRAAVKEACELPCDSILPSRNLSHGVEFRPEGLSVAEVEGFFALALRASKRQEPNIESGNKYGVSDEFHSLNGSLLFCEYEASPRFAALSQDDRDRLLGFLKVVLLNPDLRNRNPLHPSTLDACVIGNLVNFPKHVFNFPFGSYATDGRESLSLCLYGYRVTTGKRRVAVVGGGGDEVAGVARRLGMAVVPFESLGALDAGGDWGAWACVVSTLDQADLEGVAAAASRRGVAVHVHVTDGEFRAVFRGSEAPCNFVMPPGVRSMTVEEGLLQSGYSLYRDMRLRDAHFDVGYSWQTAYLSPNEGGSGASTPLYVDFCVVCLGWRALRALAAAAAPGARGDEEHGGDTLECCRIGPHVDLPQIDGASAARSKRSPEGDETRLALATRWARAAVDDAARGRAWFEAQLVAFQRHFLGGLGRDLEALTTGGGTRSINLAFEAVLAKHEARGVAPRDVVVLTGNPHLAVERAERRFGFALERLEDRGALDLARLEARVRDPRVLAVFAQTLSYTDGVSDDVPAVVAVLRAENARRRARGLEAVTLINDNCLAFCVLVHNDGTGGGRSFRALDLTAGDGDGLPVICTLDAHKHLGTDKGVSTVVGTPGTLSHLGGRPRVGARPSRGHLARAVADVLFVGVHGYVNKYRALAREVAKAERLISSSGMTVVHACHRAPGSTVLAVYAPASALTSKLKKMGHSTAFLYNLHPEDPSLCQTGFALSLTPYCLRKVDGERSALDVFLADLVVAFDATRTLRGPFPLNSLPTILLNGGSPEPYLFSFLWSEGPGRAAGETVLRRLFSLLLDSGVARSRKRTNALPQLATASTALAALAALVLLRRKRA